MDIYADPITVNCRKVVAGLKHMGVDYTLKHVDYFQSKQKSPEYLEINPNASLPAMIDNGFTLWESNAILQYAADKHGKSDAYPTDLKTRSDINRWALWEASNWFPSCYVYLVENCVKPLLGAETDPAALAAEEPRFRKLAGILVETSGDLHGPSSAVIGIGVNYRLREAVLDRIDQPVIDVAGCTSPVPGRSDLLAALLKSLEDTMVRFEREGFAPFRDPWRTAHAYHGRAVRVMAAGEAPYEAEVVDVAPDGALVVSSGGRTLALASAEISLRPR